MSRNFTSTILFNKSINSGGAAFMEEKRSQDNHETSPTEAAEAEEAVYDVKAGTVVMTGNVLLTQGDNVMSGNKLNVDLSTGAGTMDGRVRTLLKPAGSK